MANYAYNNLYANTAVIVQENGNDYSVGLANSFKEKFELLTGNSSSILATVSYSAGAQNFSTQISTINTHNPDVIFAPGNYAESARLIKQARQGNITAPFIGGDTWETREFITVGGASVNGATFSTYFASDYTGTTEASTFLDEYANRYTGEPTAVTALGYDGYLVALDALKRAGSLDPTAIKDAIAATSNFVGATGSIAFDSNGDPIKGAYIKAVEGGQFVFKEFIEP